MRAKARAYSIACSHRKPPLLTETNTLTETTLPPADHESPSARSASTASRQAATDRGSGFDRCRLREPRRRALGTPGARRRGPPPRSSLQISCALRAPPRPAGVHVSTPRASRIGALWSETRSHPSRVGRRRQGQDISPNCHPFVEAEPTPGQGVGPLDFHNVAVRAFAKRRAEKRAGTVDAVVDENRRMHGPLHAPRRDRRAPSLP